MICSCSYSSANIVKKSLLNIWTTKTAIINSKTEANLCTTLIDWLENNSRHFLNQSQDKRIVTCANAFFRAFLEIWLINLSLYLFLYITTLQFCFLIGEKNNSRHFLNQSQEKPIMTCLNAFSNAFVDLWLVFLSLFLCFDWLAELRGTSLDSTTGLKTFFWEQETAYFKNWWRWFNTSVASFKRAFTYTTNTSLLLKEQFHVPDASRNIGQQHGDVVGQKKLSPVVICWYRGEEC